MKGAKVAGRLRNLLKIASTVLKEAVNGYVRHKISLLSAGVAFFTVLSLAPLLVFLVKLGAVWGDKVTDAIIRQAGEALGPQAAFVISMILQNAADRPEFGSLPSLLGMFIMLLSSTIVFSQLRSAMNAIWGLPDKKEKAWWEGVASWLSKHGASLVMMSACSLVFLASLVFSTLLGIIVPNEGTAIRQLDSFGSFLIYWILFLLLYRFSPDIKPKTRDVLAGSAIASLLFTFGKFVLGQYYSAAGIGSLYGAAGSVVALMIWVNYSANILFFGAEISRAYAVTFGSLRSK